MNVPLSWLSEYVKLPKSEKVLTDKLTMIGHLLDKRKVVDDQVVIDLELRGNRADMFGLIGVARDISVAFNTPLKLPKIAILPKTDANSPLLIGDKSIETLVKRYMAIKLDVKIGPSPKWLTNRLKAYGVEPVNNVVDVTNYVMLETSHPMHAFDFDKLSGGKLHLRLAKPKEEFETIQQSTTLSLTKEDIVISDAEEAQCITCIGGQKSKVTDTTKCIILETAVYDPGSCRRTARLHKITTEGGSRHEKHQDPVELSFTLARAVELLSQIANGKVTSAVSDYYPRQIKPLILDFNPSELTRLVGQKIPTEKINSILKSLEFTVTTKKNTWSVKVPSFRTDIQQEADIVEEVIRIWGYEKIPMKTLSGQLPESATPVHLLLEEEIRDHLMYMQLNEVITSPLIANDRVELFQTNGKTFPGKPVRLLNAPDPENATLRPSLLPNLVDYARRSLGFRQERIAFFEIGKTFTQLNSYKENRSLGLIIGGSVDTKSWNKHPRRITIYDLIGVLEGLMTALGIDSQSLPIDITSKMGHPSLDQAMEGKLLVDQKAKTICGQFGKLDESITRELGISVPLFVAELWLDSISKSKRALPQPYVIAPAYPPYIEDLAFVVTDQTQVGELMAKLKAVDPKISVVTLLDNFKNTRTLRIVYELRDRSLSADEIRPVREKLIKLAEEKFNAKLKSV